MRLLALALLLLLPVAAHGEEQAGRQLYLKHCSKCHHSERLGLVAPPLLPVFIKGYSDEKLYRVITEGLPATQMPSFPDISEAGVKAIISYLRTEGTVEWSKSDVAKSVELAPSDPSTVEFSSPGNITAVVERGKNSVWLMDSDRVVDRFPFSNVHGGLKFTYDAGAIFVPARDGWIGAYDLDQGRFRGKARACVYLRNITVSRDGTKVVASCWLPESLVVLDSKTMEPVAHIPVKGKISAVYELHSDDRAVFTYRNSALLGVLDTSTLEVTHTKVAEPIEDFFIDPFENFVIGSSRRGSVMNVFELDTGKKVFEYPIDGMPHLASASLFYKDGGFFFATSHITKPKVTIWKMYDWGFVKEVATGGNGFFVRTHPESPYLWTEDGEDSVVLIDKSDYSVKTLTPSPGKRVIHTEFSGDGRIAYVSVYDKDGSLALYDAKTLESIKDIPASIPVGKYNYLMKTRKFEPYFLGREVFMAKCWGCHHPTSKAFGPSFKWIAARRDESVIRAQILDPESTSKRLGYEKNAMPRIELSPYELDSLMSFIKMSGSGF